MRFVTIIRRWLMAIAGLMLTAGCAQEEVTQSADGVGADMAVNFSPYLQQKRQGGSTRADSPGLATLKETGFSVFACHHTDATYSLTGDMGTRSFNFMYNEQLTWNATEGRWEYSPVKYWPNGTDEANADNSPSNTATEANQTYLSFFAIAPYFEYKSDKSGYPDCITDLTASNVASASSYVTYESPLKPGQGTDLLWAGNVNLYKQKTTGEGYVNGHVQMPFVHALTQLGVTVQARVDESDGYHSDLYSDEVNERTRILIESVTLTNATKSGNLYIANQQMTPRWADFTTEDISIDGSGTHATVTASLSNTYTDGAEKKWAGKTGTDYYLYNSSGTYTDTEAAATAFAALPEGVTNVEQNLYAEGGNFLMPPSTLNSVVITYYVVTYDEHLELNAPQYFSIVKNEVTYSGGIPALENNKVYRLRLLLGLTSVKFELLELEEWGETVILSAIVKDWDVETKEYDVE